MFGRVVIFAFVMSVIYGCEKGETKKQGVSEKEKEGVKMSLEVESSVFKETQMIPPKYTCDGEDISPPLSWSAGPEGTESYAIISDDPDAPSGNWVHWVMWNIPNNVCELPEGVAPIKELEDGSRQGMSDFRRTGYGGPCPPSGTHRYYFKIYALDKKLDLSESTNKAGLVKAMEGHVLAEGSLMGKYKRW